jgi:predicted dehydrogenase
MMKVAIIGTGAIVERAHLPSLAALADVEVAVICGRNTERTSVLAREYGIPLIEAAWRQTISRADLDAVIIANHNAAHAEIAAAALQAGKHVFCEKPLAVNASELETVSAALAGSDRVFAVNYNMRRLPELAAIKRAIDAQEFGALRTLRLQMRRREGIPGLGSWFTRRDHAGGGSILDLGSHLVDLALWFTAFSPARRLDGRVWADHGPRQKGGGAWRASESDQAFDVDDRAILSWWTDAGVRIGVDVAWAFHGPEGLYCEVVGDRGGVALSPATGSSGATLRYFRETEAAFSETLAEPPAASASRQAWATGVEAFIGACKGDRVDLADYSQAAAGLDLLFRVRDQQG